MGLETGTYISDLVATNPVGASDQANTADDHLRLIKSTIKATFPSITGAVNASQTELNQLGSGSLSASVVFANLVSGPGSTASEPGFIGIPQNSQSGNYTCVLSDRGKEIYHPNGAGSGDTFTIPANSSVAYPVGTCIYFTNDDSSVLLIAITTDTMTLAGTTTTGTRTLAQNGICMAKKNTATTWVISGAGLS